MGCEALTEFKIATIDQPAQDILYSIEVMFPCLCPCGFCPCVARAGLGGCICRTERLVLCDKFSHYWQGVGG